MKDGLIRHFQQVGKFHLFSNLTKSVFALVKRQKFSIFPSSEQTLEDELQILVAQNRIKPLTQDDLRKVHQIKRTFGARIAE